MDVAEVYLELYGRIPPLAERAVAGLETGTLTRLAGPGTNPIGWLVWHLARVQDHHVADLLDTNQVWVGPGSWGARFGLTAAEPEDTGYGHSPDDVAAIRPDGPGCLLDYLGAVQTRTVDWLAGLVGDDLDRIVDRSWDPPVTLGVRLVSIADDSLQHLGQACYLRGLFGV